MCRWGRPGPRPRARRRRARRQLSTQNRALFPPPCACAVRAGQARRSRATPPRAHRVRGRVRPACARKVPLTRSARSSVALAASARRRRRAPTRPASSPRRCAPRTWLYGAVRRERAAETLPRFLAKKHPFAAAKAHAWPRRAQGGASDARTQRRSARDAMNDPTARPGRCFLRGMQPGAFGPNRRAESSRRGLRAGAGCRHDRGARGGGPACG